METPDLGAVNPAAVKGAKYQADFFFKYLCWEDRVLQAIIILNYALLSCFKHKSKRNKFVIFRVKLGHENHHSEVICGDLPGSSHKMNLTSSLWNEGAWSSEPQFYLCAPS